jgi:alanyl-tRNA synthetase
VDAYPGTEERLYISRLSLHEEERFIHTFRAGLPLVEEVFQKLKSKGETILPGEVAFKFYDTHGFPLDLLAEMAAEKGFTLDESAFEREMEAQRKRGRASWQGGILEETLRGFEISADGFLLLHRIPLQRN